VTRAISETNEKAERKVINEKTEKHLPKQNSRSL
jgi:hypothetical protein